jgi:hypothetical protein
MQRTLNLKKSQREKVSSYEISWVKTFLHKAHDSCGGQPRKLINPTTNTVQKVIALVAPC